MKGDREGFALMMALLAIVVVTGGVVTAYNVSTSERRSVEAQASRLDAFLLAETGREIFVAEHRDLLGGVPEDGDSVRIELTGGRADVVIRLIRTATSTEPAIYFVRSRGQVVPAGWAGEPVAERTVGQYMNWEPEELEVKSAWTSIAGLTKQGGSGTLGGHDHANPRCDDGTDVAGVAVPTVPGYVQDGGDSVPTGEPPIDQIGLTSTEAAAAVNIDWASIIDGSAITPDLSYPAQSFPTATQFSTNPDWYPIIYVDETVSTFSLPHNGRGTLIVRNDMIISGGLSWDGVLLVGGMLTSNGNNTVHGATISGLNVKLGEIVGVSDVGNGTKVFNYDSCEIQKAMTGLGSMEPLSNAWLDNWATW